MAEIVNSPRTRMLKGLFLLSLAGRVFSVQQNSNRFSDLLLTAQNSHDAQVVKIQPDIVQVLDRLAKGLQQPAKLKLITPQAPTEPKLSLWENIRKNFYEGAGLSPTNAPTPMQNSVLSHVPQNNPLTTAFQDLAIKYNSKNETEQQRSPRAMDAASLAFGTTRLVGGMAKELALIPLKTVLGMPKSLSLTLWEAAVQKAREMTDAKYKFQETKVSSLRSHFNTKYNGWSPPQPTLPPSTTTAKPVYHFGWSHPVPNTPKPVYGNGWSKPDYLSAAVRDKALLNAWVGAALAFKKNLLLTKLKLHKDLIATVIPSMLRFKLNILGAILSFIANKDYAGYIRSIVAVKNAILQAKLGFIQGAKSGLKYGSGWGQTSPKYLEPTSSLPPKDYEEPKTTTNTPSTTKYTTTEGLIHFTTPESTTVSNYGDKVPDPFPTNGPEMDHPPSGGYWTSTPSPNTNYDNFQYITYGPPQVSSHEDTTSQNPLNAYPTVGVINNNSPNMYQYYSAPAYNNAPSGVTYQTLPPIVAAPSQIRSNNVRMASSPSLTSTSDIDTSSSQTSFTREEGKFLKQLLAKLNMREEMMQASESTSNEVQAPQTDSSRFSAKLRQIGFA